MSPLVSGDSHGPRTQASCSQHGSTDSVITITISSSVSVCSGVGITAGIAFCLYRKKKACFGKQKSSTSNDNRTYNVTMHNPIVYIGGCLEDAKRYINGAFQNNERLAISNA